MILAQSTYNPRKAHDLAQRTLCAVFAAQSLCTKTDTSKPCALGCVQPDPAPLQTCAQFREAVTLRAESAQRVAGRGELATRETAKREAHPDGNHGDNKTLATVAALECI